ncbi:hypothetical protein TWF694_006825 [Orbilia ellipsospora]|uniref:F-box domain-containing protein n=1 Tax=Orbilia ellipsospora TaxID=2528407 RepID=A0AAV9XMZ4_9PEZI
MPHVIEVSEEPKPRFEDLPRELLEEILSLMPTRSLVVASQTSKYIHDIATYILSRRLRRVLHTEGYRLIFEGYVAEDSLSHPYNHCEYTGLHLGPESTAPAIKLISQPLFNYNDSETEEGEEEVNPLPKLYTHYTPTPFDSSYENSVPNSIASTTVTVDSGDLFTQVCVSGSLIKRGSVIPVFDTFFRVRRDWLDRACEGKDGGVVWVGLGEDVGVRLKARGRRVVGPAVHSGVRGREEEPAVEYTIDYESLVVRATYLLEMVEKKKPASFFENLSLVSQTTTEMPALDAPVLVY